LYKAKVGKQAKSAIIKKREKIKVVYVTRNSYRERSVGGDTKGGTAFGSPFARLWSLSARAESDCAARQDERFYKTKSVYISCPTPTFFHKFYFTPCKTSSNMIKYARYIL